MQLKKLTYRNPNKILAETGHKTFDRQADYIGVGNVISTVQVSSYIRPYNETDCNGQVWKLGELRDADIKPFRQTSIPNHVIQKLKELTQTDPAILYRFRSWAGNKSTEHGYVITRSNTYEELATFVTGPTCKSHAIINWCLSFITPIKEN